MSAVPLRSTLRDVPPRGSRPSGRNSRRGAHRFLSLSCPACERTATSIVRLAYAAMGVLLLDYLALLISGIGTSSASPIGGWGVGALELVASGLCIANGLARKTARSVPLVLGASLAAWTFGHIAFTIESLGGATPSSPSLADVFYLSFFPLAYGALVLYFRGEVRRLATPNWLDGMVAGLGAAAVCAAFAFHEIEYLTGDGVLATAVNLAYPVGDVLLLLLVVGGTSMLSGRGRGPWLVLATGIAVTVIGDTFNLFHSSAYASHVGAVLDDIAWPAAIWLMSLAMWLPRVRSDPRTLRRPPSFLLPGLAATCGLAILCAGTLMEVNGVAIGLATATLALVGIRMSSSVRALRALTQERQRLAVTDPLTGLKNRRYLFDVLNAFFAEEAATEPDQEANRTRRSLAFLFIDLEHFKSINDSFGHPAGDQLLREFSVRLVQALEPGDVVTRIGGDEFGVVLMNADATHAEGVARQIRASLDRPFALEGVRARLGANTGIALAPDDARDSAGLISCADAAMYRAKLGASPYASYRRGSDDNGSKLRLAQDLRAALDAKELILYYQPQLDLRTRELNAVEALVRWPHRRLGLIPPVRFLSLAQEADLMGDVTRAVLEGALAQCAAWHAADSEMRVSVNVSPTDLLDTGLTNVIAELLARHRVPPDCLVIEITETSVITEFERCKAVVQDLRDLGVSVSLDDFGAGFTSLAYLSSLAIDELKLDRGLITRLAADRGGSAGERRQDTELVRATTALGHALRLTVVAEGIEDRSTLELVAGLGCDIGQGYFIGVPQPAHALALGPSPRRLRAPAIRRSRDHQRSRVGTSLRTA
jgi:diguanylate cyclase (GGDEF)-like protein